MPWLILFLAIFLLFSIVLILFLILKKTIVITCFREGCKNGQVCSRTGECIPEGTCLVNEDCQSNRCVDNICAPFQPVIQPCEESGDCLYQGYRCQEVEGRKICINSCSNDLDCLGESQSCINNICLPKPCLSSIDCPGGESCINSLGPSGEVGNFCSGGQSCSKLCPYPLTCIDGECRECNEENKECGNHVCRKESCLPCSKEVPCSEDKECFVGACCPKEGFGRECSSNKDCQAKNPYCVKKEGEIGICTCTLLPQGERCFDSLSCLNGSCRDLGGDPANRKCATVSCLVNEDCPQSTPYCSGGICTSRLLGSNCPAGEESLCTNKGFYCPLGVCRQELPGYGERCLEECKEGLTCKIDPQVNLIYKYCK